MPFHYTLIEIIFQLITKVTFVLSPSNLSNKKALTWPLKLSLVYYLSKNK